MNINNWGDFLIKDDEVNDAIKKQKENLLKINELIDKEEIINLYNMIVENKELTDRAKLFHLDRLEDFLITSKIRNTEDLIRYKESLFNK
jgi:hypothetical protein